MAAVGGDEGQGAHEAGGEGHDDEVEVDEVEVVEKGPGFGGAGGEGRGGGSRLGIWVVGSKLGISRLDW